MMFEWVSTTVPWKTKGFFESLLPPLSETLPLNSLLARYASMCYSAFYLCACLRCDLRAMLRTTCHPTHSQGGDLFVWSEIWASN
jgi:hypothetical protein